MPKRTLPGLGLEAYFDLGENGWNDEFDENFRKLSFLVDGRVKSRTTNLPGTGTDGDVYIVPVGQANANQVAIWDGPTGSKAWVYYPASEGWAFYVLDEDTNYQFDGTAWNEFAAAGGGGGGGGGGGSSTADIPFKGFRAIKSATQAVSAGAFVPVVFETEVFDTESAFASGVFTVPADLDGKYAVFAAGISLSANGATVAGYIQTSTDSGANWSIVAKAGFSGEASVTMTSGPVLLTTGHQYRLAFFSSATATIAESALNFFSMLTVNPTITGISGGSGSVTPVPFAGFRATGGVQNMSLNTFTLVQYGTEVFDTENAYDPATHFYTVPESLDGKYMVFSANLRANGNGTLYIQVNGANIVQHGSPNGRHSATTGVIQVATGDQIAVYFFGTAGDTSAEVANFSGYVVDPGVSGGGGGTATELIVVDQVSSNGPDGVTSDTAAATKGNRVQVDYAMSIKQARARTDDPASKTYEFVIAEMTGTTIGTVLGRASVVSTGGDELLAFDFSTPVDLVPGQLYFVGYTDKSGTGTTALDSASGEPGMTGAMTIVALGGYIEDNDIQGGESFTSFGSSYVFMEFTYDLKFGVTTEAPGGAATFLELTDTPSAFTGQAGNAVIVNATEDGLEFGLAPGGGGGGAGSSENWAVPWRGATVTMTAQTLDLNSFTTLSWDAQAVDTDNFWDGAAPTVFTIPAGITKVRCYMTLFLDTGAISSSTAFAQFRKNGSGIFLGNGIMGVDPGYNNQIQSLISGVIDVVEGDEISVSAQFSDSTIPVLANSFFQIEVVEATDRSALSKLHPFFIPGLPGAGATVYQTVFTETTILKTTTPTELYAGVAATGSSVFTLARNGVSVGTITVAAAGQTGTVSVGADVTFNAGDRLSVIAPGTQDATLADVAITLALQLTS